MCLNTTKNYTVTVGMVWARPLACLSPFAINVVSDFLGFHVILWSSQIKVWLTHELNNSYLAWVGTKWKRDLKRSASQHRHLILSAFLGPILTVFFSMKYWETGGIYSLVEKTANPILWMLLKAVTVDYNALIFFWGGETIGIFPCFFLVYLSLKDLCERASLSYDLSQYGWLHNTVVTEIEQWKRPNKYDKKEN